MISFRYHLITIVSIFLAIALGVVMGATFIQDPLLGQLKRTTDQLASKSHAQDLKISALGRRVGKLDAFSEELFTLVAGNRLVGVPVVLLTQDGSSSANVSDVRSALDRAGANVEAQLTVTQRLAVRSAGDRRDLAEVLAQPPDAATSNDLIAAAADGLAQRLAQGVGQATPDTDILRRLLSAGFVTASGVAAKDLPSVGGFGSVLVVVAGGRGDPAIEVDQFLLPLLRSYVGSRPAVAAQASDSAWPFVGLTRNDRDLSGAISTVDDVELAAGQIALVLAVRDLSDGVGPGDYGLDGDRMAPVPRGTP